MMSESARSHDTATTSSSLLTPCSQLARPRSTQVGRATTLRPASRAHATSRCDSTHLYVSQGPLGETDMIMPRSAEERRALKQLDPYQ
jgi:hypothetical protein